MEPNVTNPSSNTGSKTLWTNIKEWIQVIVIALIISLPIRFFIAEPFIVNGASMDPTFATGQFLIVDRLSYRFTNPARGDVIVFEYPNNPKIYYIKRIIGLPGETISIKDGNITITNPTDKVFTDANPKGLILNEPYIDDTHKSHDTLTTTLDKDNYFVMGDNRPQSSDSRVWGDLNRDLIIGKPFIRLLPLPSISVWPGKEDQ
jgi:signal peptidase I